MNREILFRGKHIHVIPCNEHLNRRWVYGYLRDKDYIYDKSLKGEFLVDENTICQYTGLTDKNGKKIFEGDILRGFQYPFCHDEECNYYAEIIFVNCSFMTYTHKNPSSCVRGISDGNTELMECWVSEDWEVIGNIYDDPELLEDKENSNGKDI